MNVTFQSCLQQGCLPVAVIIAGSGTEKGTSCTSNTAHQHVSRKVRGHLNTTVSWSLSIPKDLHGKSLVPIVLGYLQVQACCESFTLYIWHLPEVLYSTLASLMLSFMSWPRDT